jgi:hypothetical protein
LLLQRALADDGDKDIWGRYQARLPGKPLDYLERVLQRDRERYPDAPAIQDDTLTKDALSDASDGDDAADVASEEF